MKKKKGQIPHALFKNLMSLSPDRHSLLTFTRAPRIHTFLLIPNRRKIIDFLLDFYDELQLFLFTCEIGFVRLPCYNACFKRAGPSLACLMPTWYNLATD